MDITADLDRCLYLQERALTQENLTASGAESFHQTLSRLHYLAGLCSTSLETLVWAAFRPTIIVRPTDM